MACCKTCLTIASGLPWQVVENKSDAVFGITGYNVSGVSRLPPMTKTGPKGSIFLRYKKRKDKKYKMSAKDAKDAKKCKIKLGCYGMLRMREWRLSLGN